MNNNYSEKYKTTRQAYLMLILFSLPVGVLSAYIVYKCMFNLESSFFLLFVIFVLLILSISIFAFVIWCVKRLFMMNPENYPDDPKINTGSRYHNSYGRTPPRVPYEDPDAKKGTASYIRDIIDAVNADIKKPPVKFNKPSAPYIPPVNDSGNNNRSLKNDSLKQLKKISSLYERGYITQEEFENQKYKIMNQN